MSLSNVLKSFAVVGLGALIGYGSVKVFSQPNESNRQIASMTYSKLGSEQFTKTLFGVTIKNEVIGLSQSDTSTISVSVEAYKAFAAGLTYSWNLPETVTIVEGASDGSLSDFAAKDKKELTIKVKGYSKEVKNYISFTIKGNLDGKEINRNVLVSSRPEDSFEYVVQETEKARAKSNATGINKLGNPQAKSPIDINKVSY